MDAQLCECTKTHCIAHFKIVYVMVCEFHFFKDAKETWVQEFSRERNQV